MNAFVNAVNEQSALTANGMEARKNTASALVDLFYNIGASRGKDILPAFIAAYLENKEAAGRIALWARDVRQGAGERQIYRDILSYLSVVDPRMAIRFVFRTPELGRWDDLFATSGEARNVAFHMIHLALGAGNGLVAKWMPRKGPISVELRNFLGMTPKKYRKTLVNLSKVVETQMCAKDWDNINFSQVPSLAIARYKKAFNRNTPNFKDWVLALSNKDPEVRAKVKINVGAVYPYDVLKGKIRVGWCDNSYDQTELEAIVAQWEALPNFVGDNNVLPMVDVSGSMVCPAGGRESKSKISCLEVAVSLGLYCADKNKGSFKDTFMTFSDEPNLVTLRGNVVQKIDQMVTSKWAMNTNLCGALDNIVSLAVERNIPQADMPKILLIMSDMQFDACSRFGDAAINAVRRRYNDAGYDMPKVVFWNLNSNDNVPVRYDASGSALVSGFSPAILKGILSADMDNFTPEAIMRATIMNERYNY